MKAEFQIGMVGRDGVLHEGMKATTLYRECPQYDHPWYREQADLIVTEIELRASRVSAECRSTFHAGSLRRLRQQLLGLTQTHSGVLACSLTPQDREIGLSIEATPYREVFNARIAFTRRSPRIELQFEVECFYDDVPEVLRGLDQIDAMFPAIGTAEKQPDSGVRQGARRRRFPFLRWARALTRRSRLLRRWGGSKTPMELYMEYEGQCVAKLTDPRFDDMFWTSFAFTPLSQDPALLKMLDCKEWWHDYGKINYRYVNDGRITIGTFPGGSGALNGRVSLRNLRARLLGPWVVAHNCPPIASRVGQAPRA